MSIHKVRSCTPAGWLCWRRIASMQSKSCSNAASFRAERSCSAKFWKDFIKNRSGTFSGVCAAFLRQCLCAWDENRIFACLMEILWPYSASSSARTRHSPFISRSLALLLLETIFNQPKMRWKGTNDSAQHARIRKITAFASDQRLFCSRSCPCLCCRRTGRAISITGTTSLDILGWINK